ncbi:MAG: 4Fe-4S double cluster binding domain-containing protein [Chloroflexota bacterium]
MTGGDRYTEELKSTIIGLGASLIGVADAQPLSEMEVYPSNLLDPFHRAVSIGLALPRGLFDQIVDRPTPTYCAAYRTANRFLDQIALRTANVLESAGYSSLPVPASQIIDRENHCGAISHKAVGRMAGLGWQGKSLLLINPEFGPRFRLATVLTDAPLAADSPLANGCGDCTNCRDACPARAIKGVATRDHYGSREEAVDLQRCVDQLMEFMRLPGITETVCGICIRVCPYSQYAASTTATIPESC